MALRHIIGHMVPDTIFDALDKLLPNRVPAEGAGCLCNFQLQIRPRRDAAAPENARNAEVLIFNSALGVRPSLDGLNATAFPLGHDNASRSHRTGRAGDYLAKRAACRFRRGWSISRRPWPEYGCRGNEGHEFFLQAMFDRLFHPCTWPTWAARARQPLSPAKMAR